MSRASCRRAWADRNKTIARAHYHSDSLYGLNDGGADTRQRSVLDRSLALTDSGKFGIRFDLPNCKVEFYLSDGESASKMVVCHSAASAWPLSSGVARHGEMVLHHPRRLCLFRHLAGFMWGSSVGGEYV